MACSLQPAAETAAHPAAAPRAMTGCECAGVSFHEIARALREDGLALDEVCRRTGCGRTCTACLPDLQRYLGAR